MAYHDTKRIIHIGIETTPGIYITPEQAKAERDRAHYLRSLEMDGQLLPDSGIGMADLFDKHPLTGKPLNKTDD